MEPSREDFCHPYKPYDIQFSFMRELYQCIEQGVVGIFESPTGTGKSLSLICGALTWLRDHKRRGTEGSQYYDSSDWLKNAEAAMQRSDVFQERLEFESKLRQVRERDTARKLTTQDRRPAKQKKLSKGKTQNIKPEDEEFMLDEYESDPELATSTTANETSFSASTQALLEKLKGHSKTDEAHYIIDETKIIFCSRTHSQLTQFVKELRRVEPPNSIVLGVLDSDTARDYSECVKHISLGSRRNLCINSRVLALKTSSAINERCLELQKPGVSKDHKCQFLPTKDSHVQVEDFRESVLAQIYDIEDLAHVGRERQICPYYAARTVISPSEILTLPYPLLLQKSAREALGVPVKNNIVIIDEAHNLMDAISETYAVTMRLSQCEVAAGQVSAYAQRFKNRLKDKNRVYLTQILRLLYSIIDCLKVFLTLPEQSERGVTTSQLLAGKGVDQIKPHKVIRYLHESKLAYKVEGYADSNVQDDNMLRSKGVLTLFQSFLVVLMNPAEEGRFFASCQDKDVSIRYTLLDPREHFKDIVLDARAVILAGGTMSPVSDYIEHLFPYVASEQLRIFNFGHIIPKQNLFVQPVSHGPSKVDFDFTFAKRSSETMIIELGILLMRVCDHVPHGVVVFFPSYEYLCQVTGVWSKLPMSQPLINSLQQEKVIFEEKKTIPVEDLLRDYAQTIDSGKGALLLAVIGGKLSEGINFSDKLGRAVVAVGLPFPNPNNAEWKAKLEYVEQSRYKQLQESTTNSDTECRLLANAASKDFYENACMRAVNQSIGRVIRHINDYAAILLVDRRFATDRIKTKLPGWIQSSVEEKKDPSEWEAIEQDLQEFFRLKK